MEEGREKWKMREERDGGQREKRESSRTEARAMEEDRVRVAEGDHHLKLNSVSGHLSSVS